MTTFTSVYMLRNTQQGLTKSQLCLINGNPLYAPEASDALEHALINPNPKGGES